LDFESKFRVKIALFSPKNTLPVVSLENSQTNKEKIHYSKTWPQAFDLRLWGRLANCHKKMIRV
jgi:hypothetical protein